MAEDRHSSAYALMLEAIAEYIDRGEKHSRYRQEALASWQEYQETGKHITADETIACLKFWGTEHEQDAPACHK